MYIRFMKNLLAQLDPVTLSEKLLNRRVKRPFYISGKLGFLNLEIAVNISL